MTVRDLFEKANLSPLGPVRWETEVSEMNAGVYVVSLLDDANGNAERHVDVDCLEDHERGLWIPNEGILYIGQTTKQTLKKRVHQFYKHVYGQKSPHRGGQAIKLLNCALWVYWATPNNPKESERALLKAFRERTGRRPFGNRKG